MFRPDAPGERPTLGAEIVPWVETMLASPDGSDRVVLTREQVAFVLRFYELTVESVPRRRYRRAVLSRAKGWGRSPFLAMVALAEAFAPVVPDGWDAKGRPVGKPWSTIRSPWVQVLAVSEDQTRNAWLPLLDMVREGPLIDEPGVEALASRITLPRGGRIEFVTASAVSREGNRPVFAILDQTESWTTQNGGARLAAAVRRNLGKTDGASIESPNAYKPGASSVSEATFDYATAIRNGEARDDGLLFDHRQAPPLADLADDAELLDALRYAYGDSSNHPDGCVLHDPPCPPPTWGAPLERIMRERLDTATTPESFRQFFLNEPVAAEDAFITPQMLDMLPKPKR